MKSKWKKSCAILIVNMCVCLCFGGCSGEKDMLSKQMPEETESIQSKLNVVEKESPMIREEEASEYVKSMTHAMENLVEKISTEEPSNIVNLEVEETVTKFFDQNQMDYVLFMYGIDMENGSYVVKENYDHTNFFIDTSKEIRLQSQENGICVVEATFIHRWKNDWVEECVPIIMEYKEDEWKIAKINQWYNDFRYNYLDDKNFAPLNFTKKQAEELIQKFGTDGNGNPVKLSLHIDANGYLLAESSERQLTDADLDMLSRYELYFAGQEIYARHGKKFSDSILEEHFAKQPWYSPYEKVFAKESLSQIEINNIELIKEKGNFLNEMDEDYANLYPIKSMKNESFSAEEAVFIVQNAFSMIDQVVQVKEENYISEKSGDDFQYYTLGKYSDGEKLREYLLETFSDSVIDKVLQIYQLCRGLHKDDNGNYEMIADGTYYGDWQKFDTFTAAEILSEDENECRVSIAFINRQVAWECSAEHSQGEFLLQKEDNQWKIIEFSQTYYDELIREFGENF